MAKRRNRRGGEFDAAICGRCELPLEDDGTCPNARCPYHDGFQDEVVTNDLWPSEEERRYIEQIRERLKGEP
jgi:hypothetical protein